MWTYLPLLNAILQIIATLLCGGLFSYAGLVQTDEFVPHAVTFVCKVAIPCLFIRGFGMDTDFLSDRTMWVFVGTFMALCTIGLLGSIIFVVATGLLHNRDNESYRLEAEEVAMEEVAVEGGMSGQREQQQCCKRRQLLTMRTFFLESCNDIAIYWNCLTLTSTLILGIPLCTGLLGDEMKGIRYSMLAGIPVFLYQFPGQIILLELHDAAITSHGCDTTTGIGGSTSSHHGGGGKVTSNSQGDEVALGEMKLEADEEEDINNDPPQKRDDLLFAGHIEDHLSDKTANVGGGADVDSLILVDSPTLGGDDDNKNKCNSSLTGNDFDPKKKGSRSRVSVKRIRPVSQSLDEGGAVTLDGGSTSSHSATTSPPPVVSPEKNDSRRIVVCQRATKRILQNTVVQSELLAVVLTLSTVGPRFLSPLSEDSADGLKWIYETVSWLGSCASPVSIFCMGAWMQHRGLKKIICDHVGFRRIAMYMMLKLLIVPLVMMALVRVIMASTSLNDDSGDDNDDDHYHYREARHVAVLISSFPIAMLSFPVGVQYNTGESILSANFAAATVLLLPSLLLWEYALNSLYFFHIDRLE